jgi:hypothetical protein
MDALEIEGFSVEEFARRYSLGRTKAFEEIAAGHLVARKVGKRTIIMASDAKSWAENLPRVAPKGDASLSAVARSVGSNPAPQRVTGPSPDDADQARNRHSGRTQSR